MRVRRHIGLLSAVWRESLCRSGGVSRAKRPSSVFWGMLPYPTEVEPQKQPRFRTLPTESSHFWPRLLLRHRWGRDLLRRRGSVHQRYLHRGKLGGQHAGDGQQPRTVQRIRQDPKKGSTKEPIHAGIRVDGTSQVLLDISNDEVSGNIGPGIVAESFPLSEALRPWVSCCCP